MAAPFSWWKYKTDPHKKTKKKNSYHGGQALDLVYQVSDSDSFLVIFQKRLLNSEKIVSEWGKYMRPSFLTSDRVGQCSCGRWESNKSVAKVVNIFLQMEVVRAITSAFWLPIKVKWPLWTAEGATSQIPPLEPILLSNPLNRAQGI